MLPIMAKIDKEGDPRRCRRTVGINMLPIIAKIDKEGGPRKCRRTVGINMLPIMAKIHEGGGCALGVRATRSSEQRVEGNSER